MPRAAFAFVPLIALAFDTGPGPARAADAPKPETRAPDTRMMPATEAIAVLGHVVDGTDGKDVGRLVDVLVDQDGSPRAAVLDVGGFLGVGNRVVSVEWSALHFDPANKDHPITTQLTPDQLKAAPEYKGAAQPSAVVIAPAGQH